jgi:hypothetical protein
MTMQLYTLGANQQLVDALVRSGARFIVIGSLAVHYYVLTREVNDLDLLIEPSRETTEKVIAALSSCPLFRFDHTAGQILEPRRWVQIPVKPYFNVDLIIPGHDMNFDEHWQQAWDAKLGSSVVKIASRETLITLLSQSTEPKLVQDILRIRQTASHPSPTGDLRRD